MYGSNINAWLVYCKNIKHSMVCDVLIAEPSQYTKTFAWLGGPDVTSLTVSVARPQGTECEICHNPL